MDHADKEANDQDDTKPKVLGADTGSGSLAPGGPAPGGQAPMLPARKFDGHCRGVSVLLEDEDFEDDDVFGFRKLLVDAVHEYEDEDNDDVQAQVCCRSPSIMLPSPSLFQPPPPPIQPL
jgi:hypothetical protein